MQKLEEYLRARVVGQDHALTTVAQVLRRSRADLKEANKPIGVFFFVGPTGTGKTELAKTIAELLFNDEQALIRFDMSEFKEEHSAALLYGAPPGYVGYKEGGLLVNKIRQRPYSVVLFDEIEKGHPNVYDIFLQIVDEGKVTDKLKKEGDFSNAIVIFTSNLGAEWVAGQFRDGSPPTNEDMRNFMKDLIGPNGRKVFRPEFLARRIEMVPFAPISREVADLIFGIHFKNFCKLLDQQKISLELGQAAREKLVEEGYSEVFGARPIKDTIENRLGTPIAEKIIAEEVKKGSRLSLDLDEEGEWSWTVN
jgi:ATP-dependent Clp protease ATP-binding subunit ClpA